MRWRKRKDDEAPAPSDAEASKFEDDTDSWAQDVREPVVDSTSAAEVDRDRWGDEPSPPPPPSDDAGVPPSAPSVPEPARPDVPVQLGDLDAEELGRAMRRVVARALAEDLGPSGDVTSIATIPPATTGVADVVAREPLVVAGIDAVTEVYRQLDPRVTVTAFVDDGTEVAAGTVLATVTGPLRTVLTGERTALNLVGRLSGVASTTRTYAQALAGTGVAVRDTRKTTPGLRLLEKAAVAAGGGASHRLGLHDALLVKDNHVLAAGSAREAARAALARSGGRPVQVEVTTLEQIDAVIEEGVVDLLLDNFDLDGLRAAVARIDGRAAVEASGGVTLDTIAEVAATGVDRIAVGALTHQSTWRDVALDVTGVDHSRLASHMPVVRPTVTAGAAADVAPDAPAATEDDVDFGDAVVDAPDEPGAHDPGDPVVDDPSEPIVASRDDDEDSSPLDDVDATDELDDVDSSLLDHDEDTDEAELFGRPAEEPPTW